MSNVYDIPESAFQGFSRRLELRWIVVRHSVVAVAFWTVAIIIGAWLRHWGLGWMNYALFTVWVYFALPGMVAHLQMISDVVSYAVTGRTHFFPLILELVESGELDRRREALPPAAQTFLRFTTPLFSLAADTTPLVGIAIWAIIVLVRMPKEAHAPGRHLARTELKRAVRLAHKIEYAVAEDWAGKQFAFAA